MELQWAFVTGFLKEKKTTDDGYSCPSLEHKLMLL